MRLYPIETGNFKLDGGAMFGVVPKVLWNKTNPADSNNMIDMAARCLLIENGKQLVLIDNGMGDKQSEKFFGYYYRWGNHSLDASLKKYGFHRDDITDVFMTHLHFDHCGGSIKWNKGRTGYEPAFKNATFWTDKDHWQWAINPNPREKASFLKENLLPMEESGQLKFIEASAHREDEPKRGAKGGYDETFILNSNLGFDILFVDGHTEKMMIPHIKYKGKALVFAADLIPTVGHIPLVYVMGYDTRPLLTLVEKERFLNNALENNYYLFFEHDAHNEICNLRATEKGIRLGEKYTFNELFG